MTFYFQNDDNTDFIKENYSEKESPRYGLADWLDMWFLFVTVSCLGEW